MKRTKKLLILLIALVFAAGAYTAITLLTKEEEEISSVVLLESGQITSLKYGDVNLALKDDSWYCVTDENFPLNQTYPQNMAASLAVITAEHTVGTGDLGDYGLDENGSVITFEADGQVHTLTIGDMNSLNSCYYALLDNSEQIYMVSSSLALSFNYSLYDMATVDTLPDITDLSAFTIETEAASLSLYAPEDPYEVFYSNKATWFALTDEAAIPLDDAKVSSLTTYLTTLSLEGSCVDYSPKELSVYGLDSPQMTVSAAYKDSDGKLQTFTVKVGDLSTDSYYMQISGSDMVYKLSSDTYTVFKEASLQSLEDTELFKMNIEDTSSITYVLDGKTETVKIEVGEEENSYTAKGVKIGNALIEEWFAAMNFSIDKVLEENTEAVNAPYITLKFNGVYGELSMEISEYDINFYLVSFNGQSRHLINKNYVEEFANQTRALLSE